MTNQQVQIEYKHIEGSRHDGQTRWRVTVYTAATEFSNGQHRTYKKVVRAWEHPLKSVLTNHIKQMYSNDEIVEALDLTPTQPALF
jgi:dsRNA-specific ribonuclease